MVTENAPNPYETAEATLRAKEERLVVELSAVRQSLAAISAARSAAGNEGLPASNLPAPVSSMAVTAPAIAETYRGMGLEVAAALFLSKTDQIELTARQIWSGLADAGFTLLSDRPEGSVNWALRKREKKVGDVVLVGDGKWGMVAWYSKERVREIRAQRTNASGRNHAEHVARTKAGIDNAKRTRLDHWGPKRKINGEQMAAAYYAFQGGAKSKLQLAKAANMAWPTFNLYWSQYELENWRPNDPFPPKRREVLRKKIRLENMWPRESGHVNGHAKDDDPQLTLRAAE
jgi:hypothetical protein